MPNLFLQLFPLLQLTEAQQEQRKELILTLMMIIFGLIIATLVVMVVIILFRRNKANKEREEARKRNGVSAAASAQTQQEIAAAKTSETKPETKIIINDASSEVAKPNRPQVQKIEEKKVEIIPEKAVEKEAKTDAELLEKKIPDARMAAAVEQPRSAEPKEEKKPIEVKTTQAPSAEPKSAVSSPKPEVPKAEPQTQVTSTQNTLKKPDAEKTPEEKLKEIQQRLQELKKDPKANQFKTIEEVKKAAGVESVKLPPKPKEKKPDEAPKPADSKPLSSAAKAEEIRQKIALWAKELKEANEAKSPGSNTPVTQAQPTAIIPSESVTKPTENFDPQPAPAPEMPVKDEAAAPLTATIEKSSHEPKPAPQTPSEIVPEITPEDEISRAQNSVINDSAKEEPAQESPIRQLIDEISKPDSYYSEILKSASIDLKAKTLTIDGVKMTFTEWIESLESSNE